MAIARSGGIACVIVSFAHAFAAAAADQAVDIEGALALLNLPSSPSASIIMIPGGNGRLGIRPDGSLSGSGRNQLVRTRKDYLKHGLATLTVDQAVSISAAITYMRKYASPVVLVATSRGSLRVPAGLVANPDGIVLSAALLGEFRRLVVTPSSLPQMLIIHHRQDRCHVTPPSEVGPFQVWGGAKVTVVWMTGGIDSGDPCKAQSYHGFNGLDDVMVSTIAQFVHSRR